MASKIPSEIYEGILEHSIILAVDVVIYNDKGEVFLAKRTQDPCKDQWWIPGGRQFKREMPEKTALRKAIEEVGLEIKVEKLIMMEDIIFDETDFPNVKTGVHYVARVYLAKYIGGSVKLDNTQSEYKWVNKIDENYHPYVKRALIASGIFSN